MTDGDLLQMLRENTEDGLRTLIHQYGGYVYTVVRSKLQGTGSEQDIEETVSDCFVMLWQYLTAHPEAEVNLRAMLAVIAKRQAINRFYSLTRQPVCESIEALLEPPHTDAPDERILLIESVKSLGEPDAEIILRRYYFGQTSKEIGEALDLKPNTVDQKISRGIKRLRDVFEREV